MDRKRKGRPGRAAVVLRALAMLALVLAAGSVAAVPAGDAADLVITLEAAQAKVARSDGVTVRVTVSNPGAASRRVLRWLLPVGTPGDSLFEVTRDGVPVAYLGPLIKRRAPSADDYLTLAPGESRRFTVDLAQYYDFSVSARYLVAYDTGLLAGDLSQLPGAAKVATRVATNAVAIAVEGRPAFRPAAFRAKAVVGSNSFVGCSASEQGDLIAARAAADRYAILAREYFDAGRTGVRYGSWFGTYALGRYDTVSNHFDAIGNALQTASPMQFDCSTCNDDFYAYVFPNQPYVIYLCNAFWSAPATGTDSKAGTLVHELSHFTVLGGTDDHAYGQTNARNLALSNPTLAVDNADSHEYFAENTPAEQVTVPEAPTALVATAGSGLATIVFQPGYSGGAAVSNFQFSTDNGPWTAFAPADTTSPVTVPNLANGGPYTFRLRAVNAVGLGAASAASNAVSLGAPAQADLGVAISRASPATARLHEGLVPADPVAVYRVQITNQRPSRIDGITTAAAVGGALRNVLWTCSIPGAGCSPANGSGAPSAAVSLNAGQVATLELSVDVAPGVDFAEVHARAALPAGLPPLAGSAEVRASLIEPATASGVYRSGFE
jgi:peptidyl-Lys metalloendopeptidase